MSYYILSLKHTHKSEEQITLWRPDNQGYTIWLNNAGKYAEPEKGYHDDSVNRPVPCDVVDKLSVTCNETGNMYLPNTQRVLKELGI